MLVLFQVLVIEMPFSIDGVATCSIAVGEVTTLSHETWDNSMKDTVQVVKIVLLVRGLASAPSAKLDEVVRRVVGDSADFNFHASNRLTSYRDIQEGWVRSPVAMVLQGCHELLLLRSNSRQSV